MTAIISFSGKSMRSHQRVVKNSNWKCYAIFEGCVDKNNNAYKALSGIKKKLFMYSIKNFMTIMGEVSIFSLLHIRVAYTITHIHRIICNTNYIALLLVLVYKINVNCKRIKRLIESKYGVAFLLIILYVSNSLID